MAIGTWQQPDFETQSGVVYKTNLDNCLNVASRFCSWFAPHEQSTPNMSVRIDPGWLWSSGELLVVGAQSTPTITAPESQYRIDRIVIEESTGESVVISGLESTDPAPPSIPSGYLPIAQVFLSAGQTAILNIHITDERVFNYSTGNTCLDGVYIFGMPGYSSLDEALTSIGEDPASLIVPSGTTIDISSSLTIPANVHLVMLNGSLLNIQEGGSVNIEGRFDAGLYHVIATNGNSFTFSQGSVDHIYPQWFGAKGDNSTDDTASIQSALNAAASGGVPVYFPGGVYLISSTISAEYKSVHIRGESWETTVFDVLTPGAPDADAFAVFSFNEAPGSILEHFKIRGYKDNYSGGDTYTQYGRGIKLVASSEFLINHIKIEEQPGFGIWVESCDRWRIQNCDIKNVGHPRSTTPATSFDNADCILIFRACSDWVIENCNLYHEYYPEQDPATAPVRGGIVMVPVEDNEVQRGLIQNCWIYNLNRSIHGEPAPKNITVKDCWLERARQNVYIYNISSAFDGTFFFDNCVFKEGGYNGGTGGVKIDYCASGNKARAIFRDCRFIDCNHASEYLISSTGPPAENVFIRTVFEKGGPRNAVSNSGGRLDLIDCIAGSTVTLNNWADINVTGGKFNSVIFDNASFPSHKRHARFNGVLFDVTDSHVFSKTTGSGYLDSFSLTNCTFRLNLTSVSAAKTYSFWNLIGRINDCYIAQNHFQALDKSPAVPFRFGNYFYGTFNQDSCNFWNCSRNYTLGTGATAATKFTSTSSSAPTSKVWRAGDLLWKTAPSPGQSPGWICTTAGGSYTENRQNSKAYSSGTWVRWNDGDLADSVWECVVGGTTNSSPPSVTGSEVGDEVVDGTVTWCLRASTSAVFTAMANLSS